MLDDQKLEKAVQDLIIDICEVLHRRGYDAVPVGAMMRLVGVSDERAAHHDNDFYPLDKDFESILAARRLENHSAPRSRKRSRRQAPDGVTLH